MSETLQENPYQPGTPEYDAYMHAQGRGAYLGGLALGPGALSFLLPADVTGNSGLAGYLPGAATGFYGSLGQLIPKALNYATGTNLPAAPGSEAALKLADKSRQNALDLLPVDKLANTPEEKEAVDAVMSATPLAVPGLGGITRLPLAARVPAKAAEVLSGVMSPEMVPVASMIHAAAVAAPNAVQQVSDTLHPDNEYNAFVSDLKQGSSTTDQQLPVPPIPSSQPPDATEGGSQTPPFQHIRKPSPIMQYLVKSAMAIK